MTQALLFECIVFCHPITKVVPGECEIQTRPDLFVSLPNDKGNKAIWPHETNQASKKPQKTSKKIMGRSSKEWCNVGCSNHLV